MSRRQLAFTMLEVMAAVGILAILYTVLARITITGLRAEGDANRRVEASLVADRALADIELQLAAGVAPATGRLELEAGDFRVVVEVEGYQLPLPAEPDTEKGSGAAPLLFEDAADQNPVRRVQIGVFEADDGAFFDEEPRPLALRTTYAFDPLAAAGALGNLPSPEEAEGGEAGTGEGAS